MLISILLFAGFKSMIVIFLLQMFLNVMRETINVGMYKNSRGGNFKKHRIISYLVLVLMSNFSTAIIVFIFDLLIEKIISYLKEKGPMILKNAILKRG